MRFDNVYKFFAILAVELSMGKAQIDPRFKEFCDNCIIDTEACACVDKGVNKSVICNGRRSNRINRTEFPQIIRYQFGNCSQFTLSDNDYVDFEIVVDDYEVKEVPAFSLNFTAGNNFHTFAYRIQNSLIERVDVDAFRGINGGITIIEFLRCSLKEIPFDALKNTEYKCQYYTWPDALPPSFYFSENQIEEIPSDKFEMLYRSIGCREFDEIILYGNYISTLQSRAFSNITINHMNLLYNPIENLQDDTFQNATVDKLEISLKGARQYSNCIFCGLDMEELSFSLYTVLGFRANNDPLAVYANAAKYECFTGVAPNFCSNKPNGIKIFRMNDFCSDVLANFHCDDSVSIPTGLQISFTRIQAADAPKAWLSSSNKFDFVVFFTT